MRRLSCGDGDLKGACRNAPEGVSLTSICTVFQVQEQWKRREWTTLPQHDLTPSQRLVAFAPPGHGPQTRPYQPEN
jgi:hypothetical protein